MKGLLKSDGFPVTLRLARWAIDWRKALLSEKLGYVLVARFFGLHGAARLNRPVERTGTCLVADSVAYRAASGSSHDSNNIQLWFKD